MWSNGGMDGGLVASGAQRSVITFEMSRFYVVAWSIVSLFADAETVKIFKSTSGGFARANETSPAPLSRIPRKSGHSRGRKKEEAEEEEEEGIRKFIFVDERSELEKERRDSEKTVQI
ncbi:hypothetical protein HZH68_001559 [Vespula germanica]|uniref:Uncharacterized protein n=1 Tax=Vespula germanica TaxID=30212 RepID=A0A834U6Y5_VESGE|nr:hypothetical protein HZH68_001559 [Vespula germanica]